MRAAGMKNPAVGYLPPWGWGVEETQYLQQWAQGEEHARQATSGTYATGRYRYAWPPCQQCSYDLLEGLPPRVVLHRANCASVDLP